MRTIQLGLCLVALTTACTEPGPPPEIKLVTVREYGSVGGFQSTDSENSMESTTDPSALGSVHGIVEGPDGAIYVLDGMNKRVVVFEADGTFRLEFGRSGEGPGEFQRPGHMALDKNHDLVVWDAGLGRLSTFTSSGESDGAIQGLNTLYRSMALAGDTAWFVRPVFTPGGYAVFGIDLARGEPIDSFAPLNEQQSSISAFGYMGALASGPSGELIFAGPVPVELLIKTSRATRASGSNRFPTARGTEEEVNGNIRRTSPVGVRDVTVLPTGEIAVVYEGGLPPSGEGPKTSWLELFDRSGESLGRADLGEGFFARLSATKNGHLLLGATVGVPLVRRLRIEWPG